MLVVAQPEIVFFLGVVAYVGSGPVNLLVGLGRRRRAQLADEPRTGGGAAG